MGELQSEITNSSDAYILAAMDKLSKSFLKEPN